MENNPKKSKAFIITFILIMILLVAVYFLVKNREQLFGTKGSISTSKIFSPLLGSSKDKNLKVIENPNSNTGTTTTTTTTTTTPKIVGTVTTDANGNKIVRAEAGEILKKGDVLYIAGFNKSNQPIVMKAIANDRNKSLVFGVAGEDMNKGALGNIIVEGILSGVPTNRRETTLWAINNPLYLSDKIYGGMTKNPPVSPSLVVPVGSVIKIDAKNGSIRIGNLSGNTNISNNQRNNLNTLNLQLLNNSIRDLQDYWDSIFGVGGIGGFDFNGDGKIDSFDYPEGGFPLPNPITPPGVGGGAGTGAGNGSSNLCDNGATDYPNCKTKGGECVDKTMTNPPLCNVAKNITDANSCKIIEENPLTYTDAEQKELDDLLRKYYIIASTLKTKDDIALAYSEIAEYKAFIEQTEGLIKECKDQLGKPSYTGPKTQYGNPWYKYGERGSYLLDPIYSYCKYGESNPGYATEIANAPYCEPNAKSTRSSSASDQRNLWGIPAFESPTDLRDFEAVLNVW